MYDLQTGSWTSSKKLDEILGIDVAFPKDLAGYLDLVHADFLDEFLDHFQTALATGTPFEATTGATVGLPGDCLASFASSR